MARLQNHLGDVKAIHWLWNSLGLLLPNCQWKGDREFHGDAIKRKHFPRNWPFVRGIHRSPVDSPHKGQWLGALIFSLIYARTYGWVNNRDAGDLSRHRAHYNITLMQFSHKSHKSANIVKPRQWTPTIHTIDDCSHFAPPWRSVY